MNASPATARRFRRALLAAAVAGTLAVAALPARAQSDYPNKPIKLVVGFTAGGISDVLARAIAVKMAQSIGQQVIVENRPGAGTTIAGDYIAKAAPDGYTIWLQDITSHSINATLFAKLPYDSVTSFTPIAMVASTPLMLVVHPSTPAKNLQELIALVKANPAKSSYGSSGAGTTPHIASEMFRMAMGGFDLLHVPYKGSSPSTQAILGNEVTFVFSTMPPAISNVQAGRLRGIAVTTAKRVSAAPDVPTMIEGGLRDFEMVLYSGILGPAGLPAPIVQKLNAEFAKVVQTDEVKAIYSKIGADPVTMTPDAFRDMMRKEIAKLAPAVKASGAKPE
jgi:tripartite-type tricarboxylate transporter receptor subunit TctC